MMLKRTKTNSGLFKDSGPLRTNVKFFCNLSVLSMALSFIGSVATIFSGHVCNGYRPSHFPISPPASFSSSFFPDLNGKILICNRRRQLSLRATYQLPVQAPSVTYAREMERVSAKESLLLAIKDSGGFSSLVTGKTTDLERIDVNERIIDLERLNPTSRPTTSSLLEGRWNFEWFGSSSTGFFHARLVLEKFPFTIVNMKKMDVLIKDGSNAEITASLRLFNSMKSQFFISSKLSVEGESRIKEEYTECRVETPKVDEDVLPQHLRAAFDYASISLQQLPLSIRDAIGNGLKLPLSGTYQRLFLISYLDEEILIIRDASGLAEVFTRFDEPPPPLTEVVVTDYES